MTSTINASTTAGIVTTADTSGVLQLQTAGTTAVSIGTDQSFNFSATGQRITGDFSNATVANRVAFQSSTTDGVSDVNVLPNGTSSVSAIRLNNNSDPTNAGICRLVVSSTVATLDSNRNSGSGTYLPMTLNTGGSESLRLSATTKAVILAGGSTSADGTGITFPATQSASSDVNTLDDYEEGSWTPVLNFGGVAGVSVYAQQNGTYTRIGNVVNVRCYISISTKSAATGAAILAGLPFPTQSVSAKYHSGTIYMSNGSITGAPMCYLDAGASSVNLGQTNGSTGYVNITNSNFVNSGDFIFQASYFTT